MGKKKRSVPEINSSSTADIAFIILIFFLVTTSMDTDMGLTRRLPEPQQDEQQKQDQRIRERNILKVHVNRDNELLVNDEVTSISELRERAKEFIENPYNDEKLPEKRPKEVEFFGTVMVTANHVISLYNDRMTSYETYIAVQNELIAAYNELRNKLSEEKWHMPYAELNSDQQAAVKEIYPQIISEAEPKKY
ncbi:MAG: biopolymer transporter ExbD [Prevotellaceae bacterium]|jgi:biopolymer transport protein ExbD|nr:biopolymer transporter ExbD [Prevotellaceae bacterium]